MEIVKKASWTTYLLGSVGLLGSIALHKSNILKSIKIQKETIKEGKFVYLEQKQSYNNLRSVYGRVMKEVPQSLKNPNNKCMSFYFDDPQQLENQNDVRSCIGFLLDESETEENIQEFIKSQPEYKVKNIKEFTVYSTNWKLNFFSFFTMTKPYKYLVKYTQKNDKETYNCLSVTGGIYLKDQNSLKCIVPLAADKEKLMISSFDKPPQKK